MLSMVCFNHNIDKCPMHRFCSYYISKSKTDKIGVVCIVEYKPTPLTSTQASHSLFIMGPPSPLPLVGKYKTKPFVLGSIPIQPNKILIVKSERIQNVCFASWLNFRPLLTV